MCVRSVLATVTVRALIAAGLLAGMASAAAQGSAPAPSPSVLPGAPALGDKSRVLPGVLKRDTGDKSKVGAETRGGVAPPDPAGMSGQPLRDPAVGTGAVKRQNCGTFWTGWMEDPDTNANPCPKDCVRGERQLVKTYKQGDKMLYEARYQCYRMAAVLQPRAEPPATPGKPAPAPSRVITTPKIEISGLAPRVIRTETIRISGIQPKVITTDRIQISGPAPRVIRTETIRISGVLPKVIVTPRIEITGIR